MIKWETKKGASIGTVQTKNYGAVTFTVKKSVGGMHFEARFMENTIVARKSTKEDAIEACEEYAKKIRSEIC